MRMESAPDHPRRKRRGIPENTPENHTQRPSKQRRITKNPIEATSLRRSSRLAGLQPASNLQLGVDHKSVELIKKKFLPNGKDSPDLSLPHPNPIEPNTEAPASKDACVESWLETIHDTIAPETEADMPKKKDASSLSPVVSWVVPSSTSRRSVKSTAGVHDSDYRECLEARNIFIDEVDPPIGLIQQARQIISKSRYSPEPDTDTVDDFIRTLRKLQRAEEEKIVRQVAGKIIPAVDITPDSRLEPALNQLWSKRVPVPLRSTVLATLLPLPVPKPDVAFGYSKDAFTEQQKAVMQLLANNIPNQSYAMPAQGLRFPFLAVEFKSQAKGGTLYIAQNQAAGAGAIAMNNRLELARKCSGLTNFNYMEPHFFSVTMDHLAAQLNVHWISKPTEDNGHGFHLENISNYILSDPTGLQSLVQAIKNILDESVGPRLQALREVIDEYGKKLEAEVAAPRPEEYLSNAPQPKRQSIQKNPRPSEGTKSQRGRVSKQNGTAAEKPKRTTAQKPKRTTAQKPKRATAQTLKRAGATNTRRNLKSTAKGLNEG